MTATYQAKLERMGGERVALVRFVLIEAPDLPTATALAECEATRPGEFLAGIFELPPSPPYEVRPDGPETDRGGLIGQQPY